MTTMMANETDARPSGIRKLMMGAAVAAVVAAVGLGGYVYYLYNSPHQLAVRAQLAMEQHDSRKAVDFLTRALTKNPSGDLGIHIRDLMAKALIDSGRESDARSYLLEVLASTPANAEALDLLATSHVHNATRSYQEAFKPVSADAANTLYQSINNELAEMQKLPTSSRNEVAMAELHHLYLTVQCSQAQEAGATKIPAEHHDAAMQLLSDALAKDVKNERAAALLAQYSNEDGAFNNTFALYGQMNKENAVSQELAITTANAYMLDSTRQADRLLRLADAQKPLETYLSNHPQDSRIMVAIGQVMLQREQVTDATKMANSATAAAPGDLDAKILLINCKLHDKLTTEALQLVTPLTNSNANVPQVWYLLGLASSDAGDYKSAGDAFKKALSLSNGFIPAKRALLANEVRSGNTQAATLLAQQLLQIDPYYMPALSVITDSLAKSGERDRAREMLVKIANDDEVPMEGRADLVRLLLSFGAGKTAQAVLATLPTGDASTAELRATVASANGNTSEARALTAKAIAADPSNVDLKLQYADMLANAGLTADARVVLDEVAAEKSLTGEESLHLGRGYLAIRLPTQAIAALSPMASSNKNVDAINLMQRAKDMLEGKSSGTDSGTSLATIDPDQATVSDSLKLAFAALQRKDYQQSLTIARGAIAKDSANARLHLVAGRALAGLGQMDSAVDEISTAAGIEPNNVLSFATFVELFPTPEAATKGLGFGGRMMTTNPALGNWSMGRLAEISGQADLARRYYAAGIEAADRVSDPTAAKQSLFAAVLSLDATQKDSAALKKDADQFAKNRPLAITVRLFSANQLMTIGDRVAAAGELSALAKMIPATTGASTQVTIATAQAWLALGDPKQAIAVVEKQLNTQGNHQDLLDPYANLLQNAGRIDEALKVRQTLAAADPTNPRVLAQLATTQGAAGDYQAAFLTVDQLRSQGDTGKQFASSVRLHLLISMGLLKEAADELKSHAQLGADDYASMLAIGQAWAMVKQADEAKKSLDAIPTYAAQYAKAQNELALLELNEGKTDDALARLEKVHASEAKNFADVSGLLFQAYLRAGKTDQAVALAKQLRDSVPAHSAPWRTATLYGVAATREGKHYDDGIALLKTLDADTQKQSALDASLLNLLAGHTDAAIELSNGLSEENPTYTRSTIRWIAGATDGLNGTVFTNGLPSTVYAALSLGAVDVQKSILLTARNPNVLPDDIATLLAEVGSGNDAAATLRQLALAQRLAETGWLTSALDVLDRLGSSGKVLTASQVLRYNALLQLHRDTDAQQIALTFEKNVSSGAAVPPSVRRLVAQDLARQEKYPDALAVMKPLEGVQRADVMTEIASLDEKSGNLAAAIAIHRQIHKMNPDDLVAANNLAYTLVAANPSDAASLAEAKKAVQDAADRRPDIAAFQETLGWIEILSGKAADGTRRLARVVTTMRLDPAIHYHLGIGYAKLGQSDLAKMHLHDVEALAQTRQVTPELPLATAALKALPTVAAD